MIRPTIDYYCCGNTGTPRRIGARKGAQSYNSDVTGGRWAVPVDGAAPGGSHTLQYIYPKLLRRCLLATGRCSRHSSATEQLNQLRTVLHHEQTVSRDFRRDFSRRELLARWRFNSRRWGGFGWPGFDGDPRENGVYHGAHEGLV